MKILTIILKVAEISRRKPKTRISKVYRWCERSISLLCLIYLLLLSFPQTLFSHSTSHDGLTLHSQSPFSSNTKEIISKVNSTISKSEFYDQTETYQIFICDNQSLFTFFSPWHRHAFGVSYPVTDNIFLSKVDIFENKAYRFAETYKERAFHTVAAHEIVHAMIRKRIGVLYASQLPQWLNEGYCEYIAGNSTFQEKLGVKILIEGRESKSVAFQYFIWKKMVEYLIDIEKKPFSQLVRAPPDKAIVKQKMIEWLLQRKAIEQNTSLNSDSATAPSE